MGRRHNFRVTVRVRFRVRVRVRIRVRVCVRIWNRIRVSPALCFCPALFLCLFLPAPSPFDIGRAAVFIMFACFVYNVFLINLCLFIFNMSFCSF